MDNRDMMQYGYFQNMPGNMMYGNFGYQGPPGSLMNGMPYAPQGMIMVLVIYKIIRLVMIMVTILYMKLIID